MLRYVVTRLVFLTVVVLVTLTVTFFLSHVIPADPARLAAGLHAGPEQVEEVRRLLGLDQPLPVQYWRYVSGVLRLDFGASIQSRQPVVNDLTFYLPATLDLVLVTFVLYAVSSVALGVWWAVRPKSVTAVVLQFVSVAGAALPVFWVGLLFQLLFGSRLNILPIAERLSQNLTPPKHITGMYLVDALLTGNVPVFLDALVHLIGPVLTLLFGLIAVGCRLTRATVIQELAKDYVRTARAKGLVERRVVFKHVLKNALNPVVTMLGLQFGWVLGGTILVEVVFSWPGLGMYAFNSFRTFDYAPIMAITIITTLAFVIVNMIVDLLYPILDPKVKLR